MAYIEIATVSRVKHSCKLCHAGCNCRRQQKMCQLFCLQNDRSNYKAIVTRSVDKDYTVRDAVAKPQ